MTDAQRKSLKKIKDSTAYFPHQITDIRRFATMGSHLNANPMGYGKSLEGLTVAAIDYERGWATRTLIIAPATLKWNWAAEITKFTHFTYHVLDGEPDDRVQQIKKFYENGTDILIVNYEQVVKHLGDLNWVEFDIIIYDEAHYIKSYKSKRTKACLALRAKKHFLLTGSPLLNQVNELWPILHRIDPTSYPKYWPFVSRYCVFGGFKDKQIVGIKNQKELTERLQGVMIRGDKAVLGLPDKQRVVIDVDLHAEQRKMYKQAQSEMKLDMPSSPTPMDIENHLSMFLRLKQICGTTAAIDWQNNTFPDHSTKLDVAVERVEELVANGERVVVFTQFRGVLKAFQERLVSKKIATWALHGDVKVQDRAMTVENWASYPQPGVIVCMLQVAGVGLNMTAASTCIFLDKLFVPKLNEQAEDRLHRIGASKTKPVLIIEIIARGTIEQRIEQILARKHKLFGQLVEQSDWKKMLYQALLEEEDDG